MMKPAVLCFSLVLPGVLQAADGLSELRGALGKLQGTEAIRAKADIQRWSRDGEGKKARTRQSRSNIQIEDGPGGLHLGWTPQQIAGARKESLVKAANPEAETPNLDALKALDGLSATSLISHADFLLQQLGSATLMEDRREIYQGRPARLLVFKLEPVLDAEQKSAVKSIEEKLKVWLDDHGVPLGTDHTLALKASKFLITFTVNNHDERKLVVLGNRLLVQSEIHEDSGSGMGMSGSSRKVTALSIY